MIRISTECNAVICFCFIFDIINMKVDDYYVHAHVFLKKKTSGNATVGIPHIYLDTFYII